MAVYLLAALGASTPPPAFKSALAQVGWPRSVPPGSHVPLEGNQLPAGSDHGLRHRGAVVFGVPVLPLDPMPWPVRRYCGLSEVRPHSVLTITNSVPLPRPAGGKGQPLATREPAAGADSAGAGGPSRRKKPALRSISCRRPTARAAATWPAVMTALSLSNGTTTLSMRSP
jgi:hypothetical protein